MADQTFRKVEGIVTDVLPFLSMVVVLKMTLVTDSYSVYIC
jgi:hypothetical protein